MAKDEIRSPLILEIKGNSLDDGPGIRSVVFYKGCPLSCVWCHNPESKKAAVEISFDAKVCINCGSCRDICPEKALALDNRFYIDRSKCTLCFLCVDACPSGALDRVGKTMSVDDIVKKILPDKPFFDVSGGGVTLSGGEPALYMEFTSRLLKALKHYKIHTLLETCGYFDPGKFMDTLYPYLDTIYFDIKIIDSTAHKKHCGLPNEKILDNFKQISDAAKKDHKILLPRTPLIPDMTDTETNISGIAAFLRSLNITEAALLAYNPLWHEKSDKIGVEDPYKKSKVMTSFPENDIVDRCRNIFANAGIISSRIL
ncbi:MAG: glycyl-radical enzyme activating protein [Smithella sp.]|jgi:pyruvate formate lyase activating enzyme